MAPDADGGERERVEGSSPQQLAKNQCTTVIRRIGSRCYGEDVSSHGSVDESSTSRCFVVFLGIPPSVKIFHFTFVGPPSRLHV